MKKTEDAADPILHEAQRRFEAAEVYEEGGESASVGFEDNRLKEITAHQFRGVGLRVIHKGRIGFASTTDLRDPSRLVEMAAASAEFGDRAQFQLPSQPPQLAEIQTYDKRIERVTAKQMVDMGREGLEMSKAADAGYLYSCGVWRSTHTQRIQNSRGLDAARSSTSMGASVSVQEVSDSGLLQVYEFKDWGRRLDSVTDLARTVLDKMKQAAAVVPGRLEAMPMVFTPKAASILFGPVGIALNGKHVHKGSSVLRGRIGEQVLDERITVTDDPAVPFAPGTCATDDEGTPTRKQHFFDKGVLKTFLTDLQTAALLKTEPSGHGFRGYGSRPSPSSTNVIIEPGDVSYDDMVRGMKRGLIIDQTLGSGQSNVLAGEFSVNVELGFVVEDGRIVGRVKDCMVAGNVYEVLKHVEAIGSEAQWLGSRCVPPIMVGGLKLAAKG
jgi:PmbA protein